MPLVLPELDCEAAGLGPLTWESDVLRMPTSHGVYFLCTPQGFYVGASKNIRERIRSHIRNNFRSGGRQVFLFASQVLAVPYQIKLLKAAEQKALDTFFDHPDNLNRSRFSIGLSSFEGSTSTDVTTSTNAALRRYKTDPGYRERLYEKLLGVNVVSVVLPPHPVVELALSDLGLQKRTCVSKSDRAALRRFFSDTRYRERVFNYVSGVPIIGGTPKSTAVLRLAAHQLGLGVPVVYNKNTRRRLRGPRKSPRHRGRCGG